MAPATLFGAALLLLSACTNSSAAREGGGAAPTEAAAAPSSDIAALEKIVRLPVRPRAVRWKKALLGRPGLGPTDWSLTAILEYDEADAKSLLSGASKQARAQASLKDKAWLREALPEIDRAATPYGATAFYKAPLQQGTLFHLEGTAKFVLVLHTM